jgi:protein-tyrosine sulfotransferase
MTGPRPGDVSTMAPVFVLCTSRSGSTLVRFLLDAHPDLACPPETGLPEMCAHLAGVGSQLAGMPLGGRSAVEGPALRPPVLAGIRQVVDLMTRPYLARRGRLRYCDKSLGTVKHAELLMQLFPSATFLCIYRHPMDVIASGIEACPWGLSGFGFDSYAAASPGNAVLALARYWVDQVSAIRAVQQRFPEHCHPVRYEDLVADPETVADEIFRFIGVSPVAGILNNCFTSERERNGPADYKIWHTSRITADSVGRGWTVPADRLPPPVVLALNTLADELGYVRIDDQWGVSAGSGDQCVPGSRRTTPVPVPVPAGDRPPAIPPACQLIGERLQAGIFQFADSFARRWKPVCGGSFRLTAAPPTGVWEGATRWRIDLASRTVTTTLAGPDDHPDGAAWEVVGTAETWEQVVTGRLNLAVALRHRRLRYSDHGDTGPAGMTARMGMLAELLDITAWRSANAVAPHGRSAAHSATAPPPGRSSRTIVPVAAGDVG